MERILAVFNYVVKIVSIIFQGFQLSPLLNFFGTNTSNFQLSTGRRDTLISRRKRD